MNIIVIIPTYNEKDNIGALIDALQNEFNQIPHDMGILVVDDSSPDGTAAIVDVKRAEYNNVFMISGEKKGLGAAYTRGMRYAIDQLGADAVMEMDADFSHDPKDLPRLIASLDEGADFVIGSRYVNGGKIPDDWPFIRRMISKWGNIFARFIAGLYSVKDCTAGFRAIRTTVLKQINLVNLRVQGYAFQMALLHQAVANGSCVREIPVEFTDRIHGETKLGVTDIIEFILNAWWIRLESSIVFIKFSIVGASGVLVNLGAFTLLVGSGVNKYLASPIAIEISIITNFLLNNYWTFATRENEDHLHIKGLKFNVVSFLSLSVSYSTFILLSHLLPDVLPQVHQTIGIVPATLVNYLLNSYWTFKEKKVLEEESCRGWAV